MSLEHSFRRLAMQPTSACGRCRRMFATSAQRQQQRPQSATGAFADLFQSSPEQQPPQTRTTTRPRPASSAPTNSPAATTGYDVVADTIRVTARSPARREAQRAQALADAERAHSRRDMELQQPRKWKLGDVYAPHDLSGAEASKWKKARKRSRVTSKGRDVLDALGINPIDHYKNFSIMSEYVSEIGKIKHSSETGLRPVNQRKMAKAIRRAVGIGLMPSVYRHPEILRLEMEARNPSGRH